MTLPQLDYRWYGNQIFWSSVTVMYIYILVRYVYIPRVSFFLAIRNDRNARCKEEALEAIASLERNQTGYDNEIMACRAECQAMLNAQIKVSRAEYLAYMSQVMLGVKNKMRDFESNLIARFVTDRSESLDKAVVENYIKSIYRRVGDNKKPLSQK